MPVFMWDGWIFWFRLYCVFLSSLCRLCVPNSLPFCYFQRLVSLVADGIYIHSLRDMKLLHVIGQPLCNVPCVGVLSRGMPVLGQDTPTYLAYSDSGDMRIFDTISLVSILVYSWNSVLHVEFSFMWYTFIIWPKVTACIIRRWVVSMCPWFVA